MPTTGLVWFSHDLRLDDNAIVSEAARGCDRLIFVYCLDRAWRLPNRYGLRSLGDHRYRFLLQSLEDLSAALEQRSQRLLVLEGDPAAEISRLVERFSVRTVYRSEPIGLYEQWQCDTLKRSMPNLRLVLRNTHTLFSRDQLPFLLAELPATFSQFRRKVESVACRSPLPAAQTLPRPPLMPAEVLSKPLPQTSSEPSQVPAFRGGASAAQSHLRRYFLRGLPRTYKAVRNALLGFDNSSKWSPWLAHGCLSARDALAQLRHWQAENGHCESSEWLYVELLWREYFQWSALVNGRGLFAFGGTRGRRPLTSFYAGRFAAWCAGTTPYPLVNACMRELTQTGYLSNRGRQIAASCLVNELALDWRYGAAWFEQQLVDYDVAVNWGNWQYLAGVGCDPRGQRHFNLLHQARTYDPDGEYVARWGGASAPTPLFSTDAADWPLMPEETA